MRAGRAVCSWLMLPLLSTRSSEIEADVDVEARAPALAVRIGDADTGAADDPQVAPGDPVDVGDHHAFGKTAAGDVLGRIGKHRPAGARAAVVVVAGDVVEPAYRIECPRQVRGEHVGLGGGLERKAAS